MKISFKRLAAILSVAAIVGLALIVMRPEPPRQEGAPAIGGPFTLVNHLSQTVTDADFHGRFLLLFFGYTFCPDVCPTTLTNITDALDRLGGVGDRVIPIFVSVDPERDTPEYLGEYLSYFHPRLVGLTGTPEQVAAAAGAYRVYYAKAGQGGGSGGSRADLPPLTAMGGKRTTSWTTPPSSTSWGRRENTSPTSPTKPRPRTWRRESGGTWKGER